jgi:hypothetical protein
MAVPCSGPLRSGTLAAELCVLFSHQPGAPGYPGQDSAVLDLHTPGESAVCSIVVQADRVSPAVKAPNARPSVLGMDHQRAPFESQ